LSLDREITVVGGVAAVAVKVSDPTVWQTP